MHCKGSLFYFNLLLNKNHSYLELFKITNLAPNQVVEVLRKHIKFLFLLLLPVYFLVVQSSIATKHTHVFTNGIIITHAHPLSMGDNDASMPEHDHTDKELQIYASLYFEFYETSQLDFIGFNPVEISYEYVEGFNKQLDYRFPHSKITLRGPPSIQT